VPAEEIGRGCNRTPGMQSCNILTTTHDAQSCNKPSQQADLSTEQAVKFAPVHTARFTLTRTQHNRTQHNRTSPSAKQKVGAAGQLLLASSDVCFISQAAAALRLLPGALTCVPYCHAAWAWPSDTAWAKPGRSPMQPQPAARRGRAGRLQGSRRGRPGTAACCHRCGWHRRPHLERPVGIAQERPGQQDHVRLALLQDGLRLCGLGDVANRAGGDACECRSGAACGGGGGGQQG